MTDARPAPKLEGATFDSKTGELVLPNGSRYTFLPAVPSNSPPHELIVPETGDPSRPDGNTHYLIGGDPAVVKQIADFYAAKGTPVADGYAAAAQAHVDNIAKAAEPSPTGLYDSTGHQIVGRPDGAIYDSTGHQVVGEPGRELRDSTGHEVGGRPAVAGDRTTYPAGYPAATAIAAEAQAAFDELAAAQAERNRVGAIAPTNAADLAAADARVARATERLSRPFK
jgi:hypothetical protein